MSWRLLAASKYPWMIAKGPLAATQAVLMDLGWNAEQFNVWVDHDGCSWHVDFTRHDLKYEMTQKMMRCLRMQQVCQLMSQPSGQSLAFGTDTVFAVRFLDKLSFADRALAHVLWQGAWQHSQISQHVSCPHCHAELTLRHMFYECPWVLDNCGSVPAVWEPLVGSLDQESFWDRGLLPKHWTLVPPISSEQLVATGCFLETDMVWDDVWLAQLVLAACTPRTAGSVRVLGRLWQLSVTCMAAV